MAELFDILDFHAEKASAITNIGTAYQTIVTMTTPSLPAGEYMISYSYELNFNGQKNQPAISQLIGDFAGSEFSDSIGDNDIGDKNRAYAFPKTLTAGVYTLGIQMKKSAQFSAQLDVDFVDVMMQRVG